MPIILAIYPLLVGIPDGRLLYNITFFVDGDIVDYLVVERAKAPGRLIGELSFPDGAVVAMVTRAQETYHRGEHATPGRWLRHRCRR